MQLKSTKKYYMEKENGFQMVFGKPIDTANFTDARDITSI